MLLTCCDIRGVKFIRNGCDVSTNGRVQRYTEAEHLLILVMYIQATQSFLGALGEVSFWVPSPSKKVKQGNFIL